MPTRAIIAVCALPLVACALPRASVEPVAAAPRSAPPLFAPDLERRIDSIVSAAIQSRLTPGAAVAVGRNGRVALMKGYGRTDWNDAAPLVDENTIYDLASLTKVVALTTGAMVLEEDGLLDLDRPVAQYVPAFNAPDKAAITPRLLLAHRAGLEAFAALWREDTRGRDQYIEKINSRPLRYPIGTRVIYSDWDAILLGAVLENIAGKTLDVLVSERVFAPLGMTSTMYRPPPELLPRIAPTEVVAPATTPVHGRVHDENANAMGGVSGHAGLFGSARDLAVFAQMMLDGGFGNGIRVLRPETIARWTGRRERDASRAFGWDTPSQRSSAGRYFSPRSFGHTGFTGTSMWMDPQKDLYVIVLTNYVNPNRGKPGILDLRRAIADAVQAAVTDQRLIEWEARP